MNRPLNFDTSGLISAKRVFIHGRVMVRRSHHGVQGNENGRVTIEDVDFEGFEVASVSLNGVDILLVRDCTASSRRDLPVKAMFSAARFIHAKMRDLDKAGTRTTLSVRWDTRTSMDVRAALEYAILNVYEDVVLGTGYINEKAHPEEYGLFHNTLDVINGNGFGFPTNPLGVAVHVFTKWLGHTRDLNHGAPPSKRVVFQNVNVTNLAFSVDEVVGLRISEEGEPTTDAVSSLVQLHNVHPRTKEPLTVSTILNDQGCVYIGNILLDAQSFFGKSSSQWRAQLHQGQHEQVGH